MGFSWSLYFCQRINERVMSSVPRLLTSKAITDRGEPVVFELSTPQAMRHYVYVDNLGIMSGERLKVEEGLKELTDRFTGLGLILHPAEIQSHKVKTLGVELDGHRLRTRVVPERLHKLRSAMRGLLRRGRCSGRTLEVVVGHATFCGLTEHKLLSVVHAVYISSSTVATIRSCLSGTL